MVTVQRTLKDKGLVGQVPYARTAGEWQVGESIPLAKYYLIVERERIYL